MQWSENSKTEKFKLTGYTDRLEADRASDDGLAEGVLGLGGVGELVDGTWGRWPAGTLTRITVAATRAGRSRGQPQTVIGIYNNNTTLS